MNYFEKVGAHHVDCDGDDGVDVSDGGDVEDSQDLPWNPPIHRSVTSASTRTARKTICLVIVADFFFYFKYLLSRVFIFLIYFFCIHGHPPRIRKMALCECSTKYLTTK